MTQSDHSDVHRVVHDLFSKIPFNQLLGLEIEELTDDHARVSFRMRDELVGNYTRKILHGGVISATLDVTSGLMAFLGVAKRVRTGSLEEKMERFSRLGTIDMRVDYLRPGAGAYFVATARVIRSGNRIAVIHAELHNDSDELVASATCTYIVG
ncbi:MAG: thioesterase family protein [Gammaproteobacteria bacterium]|nr:MAG: thioesterase family protein [Gammaproteobacteria bacterium]